MFEKRRRAAAAEIVAERTVIAAARGHLRSIEADLDRPFRVRALLPSWVSVHHGPGNANTIAVVHARACLQHASCWRSSFSASPENNGQVTFDDVRSLRSQLNPEYWQVQRAAPYLRWLEEDVDLAQRVANAWRAIVDSGCADQYDTCWCK